jgi:hypothetical protein
MRRQGRTAVRPYDVARAAALRCFLPLRGTRLGDVNHPHAFPQPQGAATAAIEDEVMALTPWEIANILRKSTVSPFTTCEESSTIVDKCVTQP